CMVDGVSATDLLSVLLDSRREGADVDADAWEPAGEPSGMELVGHALLERAVSPYEGMRTALATLRGPRRLARELAEAGRGFTNLRQLLVPGTATSLNG